MNVMEYMYLQCTTLNIGDVATHALVQEGIQLTKSDEAPSATMGVTTMSLNYTSRRLQTHYLDSRSSMFNSLIPMRALKKIGSLGMRLLIQLVEREA